MCCVLVLVSATGCMYLRLLEVKRQLKTFESYFQISEQNGFALVLLKPILLTDDIIWLAEVGPTTREETGQDKVWNYVFEKQYPCSKDEQGSWDIPIVLFFRNDRLCKVNFPNRFHTIVSKTFFIGICQSMGHANINKSQHSATAELREKDLQKSMQIPKREDIVILLGKPFMREQFGLTTILTYRYKLKGITSVFDNRDSYAWARFTFRNGDGSLLKAEGKLARAKVSMNYYAEDQSKEKAAKARTIN
jgi:hypothetical protein